MRDSLRSLTVPLALVLVTGACSDVLAQPGRAPTRPSGTPQTPPAVQRPQQTAARPPANGQGGVQPRIAPEQIAPPAAPPALPISAELEALLKQWELKSSQIKILEGQHKRTTYNLVFETEQIASGVFYLETPDKGRIDLVGTKPGKNDKSSRLGKSGHPFRLEEGSAEKWICSGQEVLAVNEAEKSYQVIPLPKDIQGDNIVKSPLPFLFGMKADEAKNRYRMELKNNTETGAVLFIEPRLQIDQQNYAKAFVMLDKSTYLPSAVKLFDPTGNLETVYKFENVKINKRPNFLTGIFGEKDPFHPNLKSYKLFVSADETEPPARGGQNDPRFNQQPIQRTGNQAAPRTGMESGRPNNN